jgi:hypothetical protein
MEHVQSVHYFLRDRNGEVVLETPLEPMTRPALETFVYGLGGERPTPDVYAVGFDDGTTAEYWIG